MEKLSKTVAQFSIDAIEFVSARFKEKINELDNYVFSVILGKKQTNIVHFYKNMFDITFNTVMFRRSIGEMPNYTQFSSNFCENICKTIDDVISNLYELVTYLKENKYNCKYTPEKCETYIESMQKEVGDLFEIKNEIITHNIDAPIFKNIEHLLKIADAVESKYKVYNTIVQYAIDVKTELDKEVKLFDISKTFLNTHTIDDEKV